MKYFKGKLFSVVSCVLVLLAAVSVQAHDRVRDYDQFNPSKDFTLTDQDGNEFHLRDHRGKALLLFFGYLSCPDVCPVTMSRLSSVYQKLSPAEKEQVMSVFISVDPDRDTPEKIKEYLNYFSLNATGLTGDEFDIFDIAESYKAYYEKVGDGTAMGYLINHTSYVYLIAPDGSVKYLFRPEDSVDHHVEIIRDILKKK